MYSVRLESLGGLGANLAGKLLGEAGVLMGYNVRCFSSYGSEKRGSPVKAFVRYNKGEIRLSTPVREPDLLGIFSLGLEGKENLTSGIGPETVVVVNSSVLDVAERLKLPGCKLYVVDALKTAMEIKSRINMVMLGAMARADNRLDLESVKEAVRLSLGKKYPALLESNLKGIEEGYKRAEKIDFNSQYSCNGYKEIKRHWGYDNGPIGGINPLWGSTVTNRVDSMREGYIPLFHKDKCINCGLCDTTCPDMAFVFKGEYDVIKGKALPINMGIDYYHCKGCLRCVEVCPVNALTAENEADYNVDELNVGKSYGFDSVGANGYITAESSREGI